MPTLYDEIKNPFENPNTINQLINLFIYNDINSPGDLYGQVVKFHTNQKLEQIKNLPEFSNIQKANKEKYLNEFNSNILIPSLSTLYNNMRKGATTNFMYNKEMLDNPTLKGIFFRYRNFGALTNFISKKNVWEIYKTCNSRPEDRKKIAQQYKISEKELEKRYMCGYLVKNLLYKTFGDVNNNIMGFHINQQSLGKNNLPLENNDIKFYINAGSDTYKFSRYFQEKCEKKKLDYYFKVANPYNNEETRDEKMCIFSSLQNSASFLQIINEIKKEHPEIQYEEPPLFSGKIGNYIGIGTDNIASGNSSYNFEMSKICLTALNKNFLFVPKEKIPDVIRDNPEILSQIKNSIMDDAEKIGLSREKLCIPQDSVFTLKNIRLKKEKSKDFEI